MQLFSFNDVEDTYILYLPGYYLYHDLRYELTPELIVDGINDYLLYLMENGEVFDLFDGEDISEKITKLVNYLNTVYLEEYYEPDLSTDGVIIEFINVKEYEYVMMDFDERDMINYYAIGFDDKDPKGGKLLVVELEKDLEIPSIKEFYKAW